LTLKIALLLALVGIICLPASAVLGVSAMADYVLDAAEILLAMAAILLIGYVAIGILADAHALKS
jgi:hypothetical protein